MVLFDPRSNARLAYRPANLPSSYNSRGGGVVTPAIPTTLKAQGYVRALHTSLHLPPFPAGTSRPRALAAVVSATLWPKASSPAVSSYQSDTEIYFSNTINRKAIVVC